MHIERVADADKLAYRDLLLLADEQWDMVERYLARGEMYVLYHEGAVRAELVLSDEGSGLAEICNLAVDPAWQRRGLGARLVEYALRRCQGRFRRLRVRTGDSPLTVPFYQRCGFVEVERIRGYFPQHYDHPIYEAGQLLRDAVVLEQPMAPWRKPVRWFTSDLHIGDRAIARWRGFGEDVEAHDDLILGRLEACLQARDELWILGDVCRPRVEDVVHLRAALPCEHVNIIVGNHDSRSKFTTVQGFERVDYYGHVGKHKRDGYRFVLSHYPMLDWDRAYHGAFMLHGHIHSLPAEQESRPGHGVVPPDRNHGGMGMSGYNQQMRDAACRRYDVGVDANDYAPVSAEQIIAYLGDDASWTAAHGLPVD